eukprot:COSAG03_NODE_11211_length_604_cov_1265.776238_1_plen_76_part_10
MRRTAIATVPDQGVGPSLAAVQTIDCGAAFGSFPVMHPVPLRLGGSGYGWSAEIESESQRESKTQRVRESQRERDR